MRIFFSALSWTQHEHRLCSAVFSMLPDLSSTSRLRRVYLFVLSFDDKLANVVQFIESWMPKDSETFSCQRSFNADNLWRLLSQWKLCRNVIIGGACDCTLWLHLWWKMLLFTLENEFFLVALIHRSHALRWKAILLAYFHFSLCFASSRDTNNFQMF